MRNWFDTLNESLQSEDLLYHWPFGINISYGETVSISNQGEFISIYRDQNGRYERPVHYSTKMEDGYVSRTIFN